MAGPQELASSYDARYGHVTHDLHVERVTTRFNVFESDKETARWIGTLLPVRETVVEARSSDVVLDEQGHNTLPVEILVEDAVVALIDQGRQDTADWIGSRNNPGAFLTFDARDGGLIPRTV